MECLFAKVCKSEIGFPCWLSYKESAGNAGDAGDMSLISGSGKPLEGEMATHSNNPAWGIPWTEEPHGLQSIGLQRVGHD